MLCFLEVPSSVVAVVVVLEGEEDVSSILSSSKLIKQPRCGKPS
jgi:hypothetical protein